MWENRCKVAVSGVGFSQATRSAETPLAAHALQAVKAAVEDSGLAMSDIDGLATYPELPATGHTEVDGISIVSVNCMMAMLKLPNLAWHMQTGSVNIGGAVQTAVNALLAGVCKYAVVWRAMHNPRGTYQNLPGTYAPGPLQFTAPYGFGGPGQHMAVRVHALAGKEQPESREDGDARRDAAQARPQESSLVFQGAAHARGVSELPHGRVSVLPVRLRYPGTGCRRDRAHRRRSCA